MYSSFLRFKAILQDTRSSFVTYDYLSSINPPYDFSDILRWQWAQSVSALDKLIHDLIQIGMLQVISGVRRRTSKFENFSIDLNTSVTQLLKTGIIGFSLLGQIGNIIGSISSDGGLDLSAWGASDYTSRGTGFTGITAGVQETTSQSLTVGNSSGSDISSGSITQAQNEATQSVSGTDQGEGEDSAEEIRQNVATITMILQSIFDGNNAIRVSVQNYGLTTPSASGM